MAHHLITMLTPGVARHRVCLVNGKRRGRSASPGDLVRHDVLPPDWFATDDKKHQTVGTKRWMLPL